MQFANAILGSFKSRQQLGLEILLLRQQLIVDHFIIINEMHLRRILREYVDGYYNISRTHLSLDKDCPESRPVELWSRGEVIKMPVLGGLHHRYFRRAA